MMVASLLSAFSGLGVGVCVGVWVGGRGCGVEV